MKANLDSKAKVWEIKDYRWSRRLLGMELRFQYLKAIDKNKIFQPKYIMKQTPVKIWARVDYYDFHPVLQEDFYTKRYTIYTLISGKPLV